MKHPVLFIHRLKTLPMALGTCPENFSSIPSVVPEEIGNKGNITHGQTRTAQLAARAYYTREAKFKLPRQSSLRSLWLDKMHSKIEIPHRFLIQCNLKHRVQGR